MDLAAFEPRGSPKMNPATTKKYCFVKLCGNNSKRTPNKRFFTVPNSNLAEWCHAAGVDQIPKRRLLICEDHLNLEEDIENYSNWKFMNYGENTQVRLKPRLPALPLIGRTLREDFQNIPEQMPSSSGYTVKETRNEGIINIPKTKSNSVEVKPNSSDYTSQTKEKKTKILEMDIDEEVFPSSRGTTSASQSPGVSGSEIQSSISSGVAPVEKVGRNHIMNIIYKKPLSYIGLPEQYLWLIDFIADTYKVPSLHVIVTLYKIRRNCTMETIADFFEISTFSVQKMFHKTVPILAAFFKQMIYWPDSLLIKKNLPSTFTYDKDFANVQSIIDCFEIQIEKPTNPVHRSLTWSQYKAANTVKYLISMTPDGFINFVSKGYGGRTTDVKIVQESGYMNAIPHKCVVLADRGFKLLESTLREKSTKLLRPPSVLSNVQSSRQEVIKSKVIASLRVHIERVIRRVRLYRFLKPHAAVNNKLVHMLDEVIIIACGLINLQSPIIRK